MRFLVGFLVVCGLWGGVAPAYAVQAEEMEKVFQEVERSYIKPITAEKIAVNSLKGLNAIDKSLQFADGGDWVSLYYKAKIEKSFIKPKNPNDYKEWADLTVRVTEVASEVSPLASTKDFDIFDTMMENMVKQLDGDSKYYRNYGDMKEKRLKHKRNFSDRKIGEVLYIKMLAFNTYSNQNLQESLENNQDAKGLILDLRGSPGGMLSEAVAIADLFLEDEIVASTKGRNGVVFYNSKAGEIWQDKPIVILIDADTASSAELLTATLQEQSRAKVVGTNSYGKGSIQTLANVGEGAVLSLTSDYVYTPSGKKLHHQGVIPDVCTYEMPEGKSIEKLLQIPKNMSCGKEKRADKGLDLDVARTLLNDY